MKHLIASSAIPLLYEPLTIDEHDPISGQFDYSPERIDELIEQGASQAAYAWDRAGIA